MIFNIEKYADGSAFQVANIRETMPLLPEAPAVSSSAVETSTKSTKKGSELLDDATLREVIKNGLPNEVNQFLAHLKEYERKISLGLAKSSRSEMYSLLSMANTIINNKNLYNQTIKLAEKQDCMSDYAVRQDGLVYVRDAKGNIKHTTLLDYEKNKDRLSVLTYGDLANQRMYGNNESFDTKMLETIHSAVGVNKVQDHIWKIVRALGSHATSSADYESIIMVAGRDLRNPNKREREGFEQLLTAYNNMGPEALFRVLEEHKSPDVEAAYKYIWESLPNNYKKCLQAKSVIENGLNSDPTKLIVGALSAGVDTVDKYSVNFQEHANKASGALKDKAISMKPLELFFDGSLNRKKLIFSDNTTGGRTAITLYGNTMPAITDDKGNTMPGAPLYAALNTPNGMGKYLDFNNVFIGNKKVPGAYLQKVAYDGGTVANAWVPVDEHGEVDMQRFKAFQEAQEAIEERLSELDENTDISVILKIKNKIYSDYGLDIQELADGSFKDGKTKMAQFCVVYGSVEDDNIAKGNWLVHKYTGKEADLANEQIANAFSDNKGKVHLPFGVFHRWTNSTYRAPIFIKIKDFSSYDAASYAGHGSLVKQNTLERNMALQGVDYPMQLSAPIVAGSNLL